MAKRKADGWTGYHTAGSSGYHMTGEDERCQIKYELFTCNHPYHKEK